MIPARVGVGLGGALGLRRSTIPGAISGCPCGGAAAIGRSEDSDAGRRIISLRARRLSAWNRSRTSRAVVADSSLRCASKLLMHTSNSSSSARFGRSKGCRATSSVRSTRSITPQASDIERRPTECAPPCSVWTASSKFGDTMQLPPASRHVAISCCTVCRCPSVSLMKICRRVGSSSGRMDSTSGLGAGPFGTASTMVVSSGTGSLDADSSMAASSGVGVGGAVFGAGAATGSSPLASASAR